MRPPNPIREQLLSSVLHTAITPAEREAFDVAFARIQVGIPVPITRSQFLRSVLLAHLRELDIATL